MGQAWSSDKILETTQGPETGWSQGHEGKDKSNGSDHSERGDGDPRSERRDAGDGEQSPSAA